MMMIFVDRCPPSSLIVTVIDAIRRSGCAEENDEGNLCYVENMTCMYQ